MAAPFEVISGPYTVYVAPVGIAKPLITSVPAVAWTKLGTSGTKNYDAKGVTVTHDQTVVTWKPAGSTGNRKAWRTEEFLTVELGLVDLTAAQYAIALNNATVTSTTTSATYSSVPLQMGYTVASFALLARGISPAGDTFNAQYFLPNVFQAENPAPTYAGDGNPAMLALKFQTLEDATLGFGVWEDQTA